MYYRMAVEKSVQSGKSKAEVSEFLPSIIAEHKLTLSTGKEPEEGSTMSVEELLDLVEAQRQQIDTLLLNVPKPNSDPHPGPAPGPQPNHSPAHYPSPAQAHGPGVPLWVGDAGAQGVIFVQQASPADMRRRKLKTYDIEPYFCYHKTDQDRNVEDVIAANLGLIAHLSASQLPVDGLLAHVRFLTEKSQVYKVIALTQYDLAVREKAEFVGPDSLCYGDDELSKRYLGVENLLPPRQVYSSGGGGGQGRSKPKPKTNLPAGLCWRWNVGKTCRRSPCPHKHICTSCYGDHQGIHCTGGRPSPPPT